MALDAEPTTLRGGMRDVSTWDTKRPTDELPVRRPEAVEVPASQPGPMALLTRVLDRLRRLS